MQTAVFTIISPNYRHYARVLMDSVKTHHADWDRFVLFVGGPAVSDPASESFTAVPLAALPLPHARQFCFRYTILELNTAVKPWMFEHLFARGYGRVVYLDPDIFVYSPLAELDAVPDGSLMVLTPHLTGAGAGDEPTTERVILQCGTYNLGFLALMRHPSLSAFLSWWQTKLELLCIVDLEHGLFVDQKWMDLAPGLFPDATILRHEGFNVAYWNLRQRDVVTRDGMTNVNDHPLRFFHFSGVDPVLSGTVSRYDTLTLGEVGDARSLIEDYTTRVRAAGYESSRKAPYAFGVFSDGSRVPDAARIAYRNSLELRTEAGEDPFARPDLFLGLRDRSRSPLSARIALRSYRLLSRARPLVRLLPRVVRVALREFLLGRKDPAPVPRKLGAAFDALPPGLNVIGYIHHDTGVGESVRLCLQACEEVSLPSQLVDAANPSLKPAAVYRANIYHVNADQTLAVHQQFPQLFASSYNIGCWHWELPEFPDAWIPSAAPLHEIWAPSAFVQSAVSRKVTIPVVHMPHGVEVTNFAACPPRELGVPLGRFTFLCMFDFSSVMTRKNPMGAVDAFRRAFPSGSQAALLIKAAHASDHPAEYAELQERLQGIPNIYLTDRRLSRAEVNGLIASSDGILSLHRSEGFGLILAEAMYLGKPVVATGWSGNMDFMHATNSCPVGYELVTLDRGHGAYEAGQQWADPDLDHAAHLLRRVVDDAAWRQHLSIQARHTIRTHFSPRAAGLRYRQRLTALGLLPRPH